MRRHRFAFLIASAALALGCGDPSTPVRSVPVILELVSGDGQSANVGTTLSQRLVVRLRDAEGLPVAGATVQWTVLAGGGTVTSLAPNTDNSGITSANWTLGTRVEAQQVRATFGDLPPVTYSAVARPGPAAAISVLGSGQVQIVNSQLQDTLFVNIADEFGNPLPGVPVQWILSPGGGSLATAENVTDAAGRARARWRLPAQPGQFKLRVLAAGLEAEIVAEARPIVIATLGSGVSSHACGLDPDGRVLCWGRASSSGSAPGPFPGTDLDICRPATTSAIECVKRPTNLVSQYRFSSIYTSLNGVTCGITRTSGATVCWGDGWSGPLGTGNRSTSAQPEELPGGNQFTALSLGGDVGCGLLADGHAYCWGRGHAVGVGDGDGRLTPTRVDTDVRFRKLSAGRTHVCGISFDDDLWCWGTGLGLPIDGTISRPARAFEGPLIDVATEWQATCALRGDGTVYCWGANLNSRVIGTRDGPINKPHIVPTNLRFKAIGMGVAHVCGLTIEGSSYCWGYSRFGEIGAFSDALVNPPVRLSEKFVEINVMIQSNCGRTASGATYCWGRNNYGQLGDGTDSDTAAPVRITP